MTQTNAQTNAAANIAALYSATKLENVPPELFLLPGRTANGAYSGDWTLRNVPTIAPTAAELAALSAEELAGLHLLLQAAQRDHLRSLVLVHCAITGKGEIPAAAASLSSVLAAQKPSGQRDTLRGAAIDELFADAAFAEAAEEYRLAANKGASWLQVMQGYCRKLAAGGFTDRMTRKEAELVAAHLSAISELAALSNPAHRATISTMLNRLDTISRKEDTADAL